MSAEMFVCQWQPSHGAPESQVFDTEAEAEALRADLLARNASRPAGQRVTPVVWAMRRPS